MNEFEKESATMDMKEEMMSDAVDDAMEDEDEGEGEEVEGDKILKEVLDEIGMSMNDSVSSSASQLTAARERADCQPGRQRADAQLARRGGGGCRRRTYPAPRGCRERRGRLPTPPRQVEGRLGECLAGRRWQSIEPGYGYSADATIIPSSV